MSTSTVWVVLVISITIFTTRPIGIIKAPTVDAKAIADAAGHPTSIIDKLSPKFLTICCVAGPKLSVSKAIIVLRPINPTPTVKPALKDYYWHHYLCT